VEDVQAWLDEEEAFERDAEESTGPPPEPTPAKPSRDFVHLHVHSEFSLLDGLSPVRGVVDEVKRGGMRAVALTDHGNLYGAIDFYTAARAQGIKPILGVEAYVSPRGMSDRAGSQDRNYFHLVLLAKNRAGYQNLLKLVSAANLAGYYYKPRIDRELLEQHAGGLIALSACYSGEPSRAILDADPARAREAACWYRERFGSDYFLELQDHGIAEDRTVNAGLLELSRELDIPVVATNDAHYASREQAPAQDILLCIQTNSTHQDPKRMRMEPDAFYLKRPEEMWALFGELPTALTNTLAIAERCELALEFGRLNFPQLDHVIPAGQTPQQFLAQRCQEGLLRRYPGRLTDEHRQRLSYELDVVEKTGFAAYILFVWDFVDWARRQGITCGPRGSAAGSIILYCLGISDVDPIGYGLTFERFLNPERIQLPDIDMDFADDRRDEVIQYVVDRYGRDRVAQIITFGRLLARAAIRDVGRALDYPLTEVDRVAKLVPAIPIGLKIDQAIEQSPELKRLCEAESHIERLIKTAKSVEGVARHAGTHAAGVVVADQPLVNYVPLQRASRGDSVMTQYDMKVLDKIGLLKMDFLGLANLTMLAKALENIRQVRGIEIDLNQIGLDDPGTYAMLGRGETRTVFQLEGAGMTRYSQELKPSTIDHLAAMVALYRPGPMAHIPSYIARRDGREPPTPPDPALEDLLRESYGIIVYQDQVLQVVRKLAGYSLGEADVLRRAMGKKDKTVMAEEGPRFIEAVVDHGYPRATAERLWELLQPFAGYAFNKAHAYCYALVAYQTAYLKANYPVEWFAAVLSTIAEDTDKVVGVINECRRLQIPVLPPDVNRSKLEFTVEQVSGIGSQVSGDSADTRHPTPDTRHAIRFGLAAVKNVGEGAVELLVAEQEANGPYTSLEDFCRRQDLRTLNKRVIESLIKCGAMDELGQREALLDSRRLDSAIGAAQVEQKAAGAGQASLFDMSAEVFSLGSAPANGATPEINPRERALWEKEVLGFQFGDHPFLEAATSLGHVLTHDTSQVTAELSGEKVVIGGLVTGVRKIVTRNRAQMAVLTLEDLCGSVEVVVFPRLFDKTPELWREDKILVIEGKIDSRNEQPQVVLDRVVEEWVPPERGVPPPSPVEPPLSSNAVDGVQPFEPPPARRVLRVMVPRDLNDDAASLRLVEQLHGLVARNPGQDTLELVLRDRSGRQVELAGAEIQISHSPDLEAQVRGLVGSDNVANLTPGVIR
jgi:DNA polymerase III subunit alpha